MFNFDIFKGFLILIELGKLGKFAKLEKFGRKIRQICHFFLNCQLSLSFKKTDIDPTLLITL